MLKYFLIGLGGAFISLIVYSYFDLRDFSSSISASERKIASFVEPGDLRTIESFPPLLQKYLKKTLGTKTNGKFVNLTQKGLFTLEPNEAPMKFKASQKSSVVRPSFVWKAKMSMSGIPVYVTDKLEGESGSVNARLLGLFSVADEKGPRLLKGALSRYVAELPWYPMGFLKLKNISFNELDDSSLLVSVTVGEETVNVEYYFDQERLVKRIYVADRDRMVGDKIIPTPWQGEFSKYKEMDGVLIPTYGQVSWILSDKKFTYFKGTVESYEIK